MNNPLPIELCSTVDIATIRTQEKGALSFFEASKDVSFEIKRVYYIYDVPSGARRGGHAHRDLCQLLLCPFGEIEIHLDSGTTKATYILNDPSKGLLVNGFVWREMIWRTPKSVLLVAASNYYYESDYIRDYNEFLTIADILEKRKD